MRIDSCRNCGIELKPSQTCSMCNRPIRFECIKCRFETKQIHLDGELRKSNQTVILDIV